MFAARAHTCLQPTRCSTDSLFCRNAFLFPLGTAVRHVSKLFVRSLRALFRHSALGTLWRATRCSFAVSVSARSNSLFFRCSISAPARSDSLFVRCFRLGTRHEARCSFRLGTKRLAVLFLSLFYLGTKRRSLSRHEATRCSFAVSVSSVRSRSLFPSRFARCSRQQHWMARKRLATHCFAVRCRDASNLRVVLLLQRQQH